MGSTSRHLNSPTADKGGSGRLKRVEIIDLQSVNRYLVVTFNNEIPAIMLQPAPLTPIPVLIPAQAMSDPNHLFWYDAYAFEVYTRNPLDLEETGWHIQLGTVHGATRQEAKQALVAAYGPYWDCIITFDECTPYGDGLHINDGKGTLRTLMLDQVKHERLIAANLARQTTVTHP